MTNKENFLSCDNATATVHYYSTLFHELIHATGHSLRLDRFKDNDKRFKDSEQKSYAFEDWWPRLEVFYYRNILELKKLCGIIMLCI